MNYWGWVFHLLWSFNFGKDLKQENNIFVIKQNSFIAVEDTGACSFYLVSAIGGSVHQDMCWTEASVNNMNQLLM